MKFTKTLICILFLCAVVSCKKEEEKPVEPKKAGSEAVTDTEVAKPVAPVGEEEFEK